MKKLLIVLVALAAVSTVWMMPALAYAKNDNPSVFIKIQTVFPSHVCNRQLAKFVKEVDLLSQGKIKMKIFPVGALVPPKEILHALGKGAIEMAFIPEGYWYKLLPVSKFGQGLPFVFKNFHETEVFMYRRGFSEILKEAYRKLNIYHIPFETYAAGLMTKKPIHTAADLKGLKIRAFGTFSDWLGKMGASTVFVTGGELYTAIATGVVDGANWGDAGPMYEMKFHEVMKNYMEPVTIIGGWNNLGVNLDFWKKLTPRQQNIIEAAALAGGLGWTVPETRVLSEISLVKMVKDWGVKVNMLDEASIIKMRAASMELMEKYAKEDPLSAKAAKLLKEFMVQLGRMD